MIELSLENLGLTQEDLATKLVDRIAENLLTGLKYDEDGGEWRSDSPFAKKLDKLIKDRLDTIVNDMANKHVLPVVTSLVENLVLQATNKWGENRGAPVTFKEYLVQRAEAWMTEQVDYQGKAKGTDGYRGNARGTRVSFMIHQHLDYEIQTAMKAAFATSNASIAKGLHEAVRIALNEVLTKLTVEVKHQ